MQKYKDKFQPLYFYSVRPQGFWGNVESHQNTWKLLERTFSADWPLPRFGSFSCHWTEALKGCWRETNWVSGFWWLNVLFSAARSNGSNALVYVSKQGNILLWPIGFSKKYSCGTAVDSLLLEVSIENTWNFRIKVTYIFRTEEENSQSVSQRKYFSCWILLSRSAFSRWRPPFNRTLASVTSLHTSC